MGGSSLDDVMSIARSISIKLSHILELFVRYKHASSIGAIAGFVIAVFCTWRLLRGSLARSGAAAKGKNRAPPGTSGEATAGTSVDATAGTSTGAAQSITQAKRRTGTGSQVPKQLTLEEVVKKQLNGGKKMTLQLLGVVLEENETQQLQAGCHVRPSSVEALREVGRVCDLYLMAKVVDDESQAAVLAALEGSGIFAPGGVSRTRVLFCGTDVGLTSFVRQIEPDWHVDSNEKRLGDLSRFVRHELYIATDPKASIAKNVVSTPTFERYFGAPPSSSLRAPSS